LPVVFINVAVISAEEGRSRADPPVTPAERTGAGHVNVTLSAGLVKLSSNILWVRFSPEHTATDWLEMTGSGLMFTTTFCVLGQLLAVRV
jgi:hypothetical protein